MTAPVYDDAEHLRGLLALYMEAVRGLCANLPRGIDPAAVLPGRVYLLDRDEDAPDRFLPCAVEVVADDGVVETKRWIMPLEEFAGMVVAGPFRWWEDEEGRAASSLLNPDEALLAGWNPDAIDPPTAPPAPPPSPAP